MRALVRRLCQTAPAPLPEHEIEWEFNAGILHGRVVCNAKLGADCRLNCAAPDWCESWTIQRDADGTPFHMAADWAGDDPESAVRHEMEQTAYCNVREFLENTDDMEELYPGSFTIGRTAIEPVWQGDYYDWKPVES